MIHETTLAYEYATKPSEWRVEHVTAVRRSCLEAGARDRDLKRELQLIPPGYDEPIRGVPVKRLTGNRAHLYTIYGYVMDMATVIDVVTGWTPMPPAPLTFVQLELPLFALGAA